MSGMIPTFRLTLADNESEWSDYRKHLGKKERQAFDGMFATVRLYIPACSNGAKPFRVYVIIISILLHHYMELSSMADILRKGKEALVRQ